MESQGIFPVDRGWPRWKWLERKHLLWHGNGLVMFHGSFDCVLLAPSIFYTSSRKMTMEELFKHSKLMTSSKNYNQWICILYPVPSCSIHCPHHILSAWNGEGCFHQGHGTVDPMEFRSTPLLEDRQEATSFRSFWMPKLGASQKSRELMKWMLFLRLRCFEHVYERQRIYTKLHPTIKAALQSEMTKCISGMQTSAHDSTVDPLNFHGHSAAQAISHASRHTSARTIMHHASPGKGGTQRPEHDTVYVQGCVSFAGTSGRTMMLMCWYCPGVHTKPTSVLVFRMGASNVCSATPIEASEPRWDQTNCAVVLKPTRVGPGSLQLDWRTNL